MEIQPDKKRFGRMPLYIHELDERQMFEMAVAENIKRRDLNPIEQAAAMQRYMDDFHATSAETGELFGVSDATVRGKVRLLALPEAVQQKVAAGQLNEGGARALLSMQRVAPVEDVVAAADDIAKGVDQFGDYQSPEDAIISRLDERNDDIELMCFQREKETPRAGGDDGWKLDMKNFPARELPDLTVEDAFDAIGLGESDDDIAEVVGNYVAAEPFEAEQLKPGLIEKHPNEMAKIEHLRKPPACTACPYYAVVSGQHYCGMKVCYERKRGAWARHAMKEASKKTGLSIYSEEDGAYKAISSWGDDAKLFEARSTDLRLMEKDRVNSTYSHYQSFKDVPGTVLVVITGETLKAIKFKAKEERKKNKANGEYVVSADDKADQDLKWQAALDLSKIYDACPLEALQEMCGWGYWFHSVEIELARMVGKEEGRGPDWYRQVLTYKLIDAMITWEIQDAFDEEHRWLDTARWIIEAGKRWGVEMREEHLLAVGK